jgi:ankyrin repeat protein
MFYPLWAAVGMGDVADLEKGGKLAKDTEHPVTSETLLHWAARRPDVAMLRYLLDQGESPDPHPSAAWFTGLRAVCSRPTPVSLLNQVLTITRVALIV